MDTSPGVQNAATPGGRQRELDPAPESVPAVYGSYHVVEWRLRVGPRPSRARLDRHHPDVAAAASSNSASASARYARSPHNLGLTGNMTVSRSNRSRATRWAGRRVESVAGDADKPAEPLLFGRQHRLSGRRPPVELVQVGDSVELIEVEGVAAEQGERLLQLRPHSVGVPSRRLAPDEEPVAHRRDQRADLLLGPPVAGRDVQVVDAVGQRLVEGGPGHLWRGVKEGGGPEDRHRGPVLGPAERLVSTGAR